MWFVDKLYFQTALQFSDHVSIRNIVLYQIHCNVLILQGTYIECSICNYYIQAEYAKEFVFSDCNMHS